MAAPNGAEKSSVALATSLRDEMLVEAAVEHFREACNSDPVVMGRSAGAYQGPMLVSRMSLLVDAQH